MRYKNLKVQWDGGVAAGRPFVRVNKKTPDGSGGPPCRLGAPIDPELLGNLWWYKELSMPLAALACSPLL